MQIANFGKLFILYFTTFWNKTFNAQWTDCIIDKIFKNIEIVKFITTALIKEHPKVSKIAKFGCEML